MHRRTTIAVAVLLATTLVGAGQSRAAYTGPAVLDGPVISAVAAGNSHTCIIRDRSVWCSGLKATGEPGAVTTSRMTTFEPTLMRDATAIAAGGDTTCAVGVDSSLWCWGLVPAAYQPQDPGILRWDLIAVPTAVPLSGVSGVAVGPHHICALTQDSSVWCWGDNSFGQLGTGDTNASAIPVRSRMHAAVSIDIGGSHTCALDRSGAVWCWGSNQFHQSGRRSVRPVLSPVRTAAIGSLSVATGEDFTCSLGKDRAVRCWGRNNVAQLGKAAGTSRISPVRVHGRDYRTLTAGNDFACAVRTTGTTWCWGGNSSGQLANGVRAPKWMPQKLITPTAVGTVTAVTPGARHACAVTTVVGVMWCWGDNSSGQLGDTSTAERPFGTAVWQNGVRAQTIGTTSGARVIMVGDISCNAARRTSAGEGPEGARCGDQWAAATAATQNPDAVIALGDLQYEDANITDFNNYFDRIWSPVMSVLYPVRGNHEYITRGAAGYVEYFRGMSAGYWWADMGGWRLIAVDSWCQGRLYAGCSATSTQAAWLTEQLDLASSEGRCAAVVMHHPPFSSGRLGTESARPFWRVATEHGADLVVTAHDHLYERFGRLGPDGEPSPGGVPLFISGLGGAQSTPFGSAVQPGSEFRQNEVHGVLDFTFAPGTFSWRFLSAVDSSVLDSGSANCS